MNIRTYFPLIAIVGLSLLETGCRNETVVGDEDGGSSASGGSGAQPLPEQVPGDPACEESDAAVWESRAWLANPNTLNGLKGHWTGFTRSGASATLDLEADGTGTLRFGNGELLAPFDDPNVGYICEFGGSSSYCMQDNPFVEGFEYTVRSANFTDGHLTFLYQTTEPWNSWCEQQTPHQRSPANAGGECSYLPYDEGNGFGGDEEGCFIGLSPEVHEYVDCSWLGTMQSGICSCTSSQCVTAATAPNEMLWSDSVLAVSLTVSDDRETMSGWFGMDDDLSLKR